MLRRKTQRTRNAHYCILVNRKAARFQQKPVDDLVRQIRKHGGHYTIIDPDSAMELYSEAKQLAESKKAGRSILPAISRFGKVTALVACGGDGTVNLAARAAIPNGLPVGILPMGRFNNIARHLLGSDDPAVAQKRILAGKYQRIDAGTAADQLFLGSIGFGFIPEMAVLLEERKTPRLAIGWAQLAAKAAAGVEPVKSIIKIDAFRFELSPLILNVNLMTFTLGLPLSPGSLVDDGHAEIILDRGDSSGEFSSYIRSVYKNKYMYSDQISQYRGVEMSIQPTKGRTLYLDGELLELPTEYLQVRVATKRLKVFC